jgi:hypothetical protein
VGCSESSEKTTKENLMGLLSQEHPDLIGIAEFSVEIEVSQRGIKSMPPLQGNNRPNMFRATKRRLCLFLICLAPSTS